MEVLYSYTGDTLAGGFNKSSEFNVTQAKNMNSN